MGDENGGRPLPWHDTATCSDPECKGPMVPVSAMSNGYGGPASSRIACAACGRARVGKAEDVAKTYRAHKAWEMYEDGLVHADRGCARCNGPLLLDRERHCAACVSALNAARQVSLFQEVTP